MVLVFFYKADNNSISICTLLWLTVDDRYMTVECEPWNVPNLILFSRIK